MCSITAGLIALAEETLESDTLGIQIPWTPTPGFESGTKTPVPEENWIPDEEYLAGGYTVQELKKSGLGDRILMRGMQGNDVALLQRRLRDLGYLDDDADGRYGRKTLQAVLEFQSLNGLEKVDGKVGFETLNRLFSDNAVIQEDEIAENVKYTDDNILQDVLFAASPTPAPSPMPTPDMRALSFPFENMDVYLGETKHVLPIVIENNTLYYPLVYVMAGLDFSSGIQDGSWAFLAADSENILIYGSDLEGPQEYVMGSVGERLFTEDITVFASQRELFVPSRFLRMFGLCAVETEHVSVIWKP